MSLEFKVELSVINSYKRLAYTPWHAIAEFVDNSTQSYFNHQADLDNVKEKDQRPLTVKIEYDSKEDLLRVTDNAMGMSYSELKHALHVSLPPKNNIGRSKYGMGLKTAACWVGNFWTIRTKKLNTTTEYFVTVDVKQIAEGKNELNVKTKKKSPSNEHYTVIEISKHNRRFQGRTLGKIKQFLSSMYRQDFRDEVMNLIWQDEVLEWHELDNKFLIAHDGIPYRKSFKFKVGIDSEDPDDIKDKVVHGWVGVLREGKRSDAGFSILHSGRVVKGWPDSWRPELLYGYERNDLINQRLIGEIHFDDFIVSHTKDDIQWLGDQEEQVEKKLLEVCADYRDRARTYRKSEEDIRRPSEQDTEIAVNELEQELLSNEMSDIVTLDPMLTDDLVEQMIDNLKNNIITTRRERFKATIGSLTVKLFLESDMSPFEPYLTVDTAHPNEVVVIVNSAHPHWGQLEGAAGVLNYLRHCVYDGIAESTAKHQISTLNPDTIKTIKDKYLRLPMEIEKHKS